MLILPLSALAQEEAPKAELFAGYSYLRTFEGEDSANAHGFNGSIAGNLNKHFGIVGDFGVHRASELGVSATSVTYLFGPRISGRSDKVDPFVHALFGGVRASISDLDVSESAFAFAVGGGLDIKVSDSVAFRIAQVDYLGTRFFEDTQNNFRYSVGIVFRIGGK